eukprot:s581_g8.t1
MPLSVGPTMPGMPAAATSGGPNGAGGDYHATLYQRWLRGEISDDAVRGLAGEELYAVFVMQRMEEQGGCHVICEVSPSDIFVAEGAATLLRGVLSQVAAGTEKTQVLLALSFADVRSFYPPVGQGDFAVLAEDIARHVSAQTSIVLLPLYSLTTGVPLPQAQLHQLGRFVDFEARRRTSDGAAARPLLLFVDIVTFRKHGTSHMILSREAKVFGYFRQASN